MRDTKVQTEHPYKPVHIYWMSKINISAQKELSELIFYLGFPDRSAGKESACNAGDSSSIPGSGRSPGKVNGWEDPGEGKGYPLQCSGLENPKDCIVHEVTKSRT